MLRSVLLDAIPNILNAFLPSESLEGGGEIEGEAGGRDTGQVWSVANERCFHGGGVKECCRD